MRRLALLALGAMTACGPAEPEPYVRPDSLNLSLKSARGGPSSHHAGKNCMDCHQKKGDGPGLFTVAGTAFTNLGEPNPNVTVLLTSQPRGQGDVLLTVEADSAGNFFTTEAVPLPARELFPFLRGATSGAEKGMPFPTMSGACNVCHVGRNPVDLD